MSIRSFIKRKLYERKKRRLELTFPVFCKTHGVKHLDRQGAILQSRVGDRLQIVHVPLKAYPHNVYVYNVELNRVLGYLHKNLAEKLVALFGNGFCRDGIIVGITGGEEYKYHGCNLQILETMTAMNDLSNFSHLIGK